MPDLIEQTTDSSVRLESRSAFTLIELLTVIAIVAVLAGILIPTVGKVRESALKSEASSNLRQVGIAALSYANDNRGRLPGPCTLGIQSNYSSDSPGLRLAVQLGPYLDGVNQEELAGGGEVVIPQLVCPKAAQVVDDPENPPPYFVQNYTLRDVPGGRVFGKQAIGENPEVPGILLNVLQTLGADAEVWLITNLDQALPGDLGGPNSGAVTSSGWFGDLPESAVWGDIRFRVYLDGHVAEVPLDAL